ncbi:MAG TPA: YihY/virulence factor BrkB family protein [Candidatus Tectomicrobia bacterium]|nr:YihY/virulence factor BrkB family protein [Candidatus Tectomicrobia bacterium]
MLGFRGAFARFTAENGLFLAAGLAFFFLVCVIPLILLGVSTLGFVLSEESAAQEVVGQLARNFPVYRREISAAILRIVEARAVTGLVGTLVLIFFSTPLLGATRLVLHRMLGVRPTGGYVRDFFLDAVMVLVLTVLLFLASSATWLFQWLQDVVARPPHVSTRTAWVSTLAFSVVLATTMFYLAYRYVPRRRPRALPALVGAVLAGLLWEGAKQAFRLYIRNVGVYDQIYGPLGVLVAFVMFVYYSAIVFVFGAAYVASLDGRRR